MDEMFWESQTKYTDIATSTASIELFENTPEEDLFFREMAKVVQASKELVKTSFWCAQLKKLRVRVIIPGFIYRRFLLAR